MLLKGIARICADRIFQRALGGRTLTDNQRVRHIRHNRYSSLEALEGRLLLSNNPVISEFLASNNTGLKDQDGNHSDWIEIYNPSIAPVDLKNDYLTDDSANLTKWQFPDTTIQAGGYLVVFADGKDRAISGQELHTNFKLSANGGYLGLVDANGTTILSDYSPEYPQQLPDISYGLSLDTVTTPLISTPASAQVLVPADGTLGTDWTGLPFIPDANWLTGKTGIGFDQVLPPPRISGFTVRMVDINGGSPGTINDIGAAQSILNGTAPAGAYVVYTDTTRDYQAINLGDGRWYGTGQQLPNGSGGGSGDNSTPQRTDYALRITADVTIPAGTYTINVDSDDGFMLHIPGVTFTSTTNENFGGTSWTSSTKPKDTLLFGAQRAPGDTFGTFTVPAGGLSTSVTLDFYERGGGDEIELSLAPGAQASYSTSTFSLLADGLQGWSVKTTSSQPPPNYVSLINTNIQSQMLNKNATAYVRVPFSVSDADAFDSLRLRMKYDDGFVAFLNGQEIARRNAPTVLAWNSAATADQPKAAGLTFEDINLALPPGLLQSGNNVLAIQGLNDGASDGDFLIAPELLGVKTVAVNQRYFRTPTPGAPNATGEQINIVADTKFDHDRGFYNAPFMLTISTATAGTQIRYTTDGTQPTATTGNVYGGPVLVDHTMSIRAAAFEPGYLSSNVDTQTYLFPEDVITQFPNGLATGNWPMPGQIPGPNQILDYGMDPDVANQPMYANSVVIGNTVYFPANNGSTGMELWKTDGSTASLVKDTWAGGAGSDPLYLTNVNGVLYFTANDGSRGYELWKSDGTSIGTVIVSDINTSGSSYPQNLTNVNGTLFFTATNGSGGIELWKSDGTAAGTVIVKDINAGAGSSKPSSLTNVNGALYFSATDGVTGNELWKSDGTAAGTVRVSDIVPGASGSNPTGLVNLNGKLMFAADDGTNGRELWTSDGTAAGTVMVKDINPSGGSSPSYVTVVNGNIFFLAYEPTTGAELWKSDGTAAGTMLVADIAPGTASSTPNALTNVNGTLYFAADDRADGYELWKSDGTAGGTMLVRDINPGSAASNPGNLTNVNGTLYFTADDGTHGAELWKSDGTTGGTALVNDIVVGDGSSNPALLTNLNGTLLFTASELAGNLELWKSTATGATMFSKIFAGNSASNPANLVDVNGTALYTANDGLNGNELWMSDGTDTGTMMLRDIYSGASSSNPTSLTNVNGTLFFTANDGVNGAELWKWSSVSGTVLVKDIYAGATGSNPANLTNVNGTLFFSASDPTNGLELWKSDGTTAGTVLVKDIYVGGSSNPGYLTNVNGTLFFSATTGSAGAELWKSDGTAAGTVLVKDIYPGATGSNLANLVNVNGTLFFTATDAIDGTELWKSDGTSAGTTLVRDIVPGSASSSPANLTNVNGTLFFTATDPVDGRELWTSDGTAAGTVLVADIVAGAAGSSPTSLTNVNGTLFFVATDPVNGTELWKSDGTGAGTALVRNINPGSASSSPSGLTNIGGTLFFAANDGFDGAELWTSDGTAAGTQMVFDIYPGATGSAPSNLTNVGGTLYFVANDGASGRELWTSDGTADGTGIVKPVGADSAQRLNPQDMLFPTFSITMDPKDLFDPSTGIYANAYNRGRAWERLASIELINPDGSVGFHINGGVRVRGGYSRSPNNPKHGFHLYFRDDPGYGGKLNFPIFGAAGADKFEEFDLRSAENYSWSFEGDARGISLRDQFNRDTQGDMGDPSPHGNFYNLYVNGQYWGLYDTDERPTAYNAAQLMGGNKDDYDVIKVAPDLGYVVEAGDGNMLAWTDLWTQVRGDMTSNANYYKIQGENPDGTPNAGFSNLLDVTNLIDYMLEIYYSGNLDAPLSNFLSNTNPNNFFAVRDRTGAHGGFRFYVHDAEHTLLDVNQNRVGPFNTISTDPATALSRSNPQYIFQLLMANPEFRLAVADRIHKFFFNGGALTPEANIERLLTRKDQLDRTIVAESARWGDSKSAVPLTRNNQWNTEITRIISSYFPQRTAIVLGQLAAVNLYPNVAAPEFNQNGGTISSGFNLSMVRPGAQGTIYYTTDGSDPRRIGGAVSTTAQIYTGAFPLNSTTEVKARVLYNGIWSALTDWTFTYDMSHLRITELMPNPPADPSGTYQPGDFQYIELQNTGKTPLRLASCQLSVASNAFSGTLFTFPDMTLAPGQRTLVVANPAAMAARYAANLPIAGTFASGATLPASGQITLNGPAGETILDLSYKSSWYPLTAGGGYSLVAINPDAPPAIYSSKADWRPSNLPNGAPGLSDPGIAPDSVVINEVMPNPSVAGSEWIELANTTATSIDISGWYLSTNAGALTQYQIPPNTIVPANGFVTLTQTTNFNGFLDINSIGLPVSLYLSNSDGAGNAAGYRESATFGAAAPDVTFGRYITSTGDPDFTTLSAPTPNAANAAPLVGPVVINEIMYNPPASLNKFIELKNLTAAPIPLYDPQNAANPWMFTSGITYSFPGGATIPAHGYALVVSIDPATFASTYGVPASVPVFGPYTGKLSSSSDAVEISRPGWIASSGALTYIVVDRVHYHNTDPWPTAPSGTGATLARIDASAYGNDPINWTAGPFGGTPGSANGEEPPVVSLGAGAVINQGDSFTGSGLFTDANAGQTWTATANWGDGSAAQPLTLTGGKTFSLGRAYASPGTYTVTVNVRDNLGGIGSAQLVLTVLPTIRQGTTAADAYTLRLDRSGNYVQFYENVPSSGSPSYAIAKNLLGAVTFNGDGGDDTLTIDMSNGNPLPTAGITFNGGDDNDAVQIVTAAPGAMIVANGSQVLVNGIPINTGAIENLQISGGGDDTLTVTAPLPFTPTFVNASGNDTLALQAGSYNFAGDAGATAPSLNVVASGGANINFGASQHLASLMLSDSAQVSMSGSGNLLRVGGLGIGPNATLDLAGNDLVVDASVATRNAVLAAISGYIHSARSGGSGLWQGPGLTSSVAAGDAKQLIGVAAIVNDKGDGSPIVASLDGQNLNANDVITKAALNGDTDLSGVINFDDYYQVNTGFLGNGALGGYRNGDFNYDGVINFDDYYLINSAFLGQGSGAAAPLRAIASPSRAAMKIARPARKPAGRVVHRHRVVKRSSL